MGKYNNNFTGRLSDPGTFLWTNTVYNKGAWVLHMLRWEVGDSSFFKILKEYYYSFKYSNASTDDLKELCEKINNKNLDKFFDQWINGEGEIELIYDFEVRKRGKDFLTKINVEQVQEEYERYEFPLEVLLEFGIEEEKYLRFEVVDKSTVLEIRTDKPPISVILDPNKWLLASINEKES
jgi:aminopeptidase N